jgi:hypothetical protein
MAIKFTQKNGNTFDVSTATGKICFTTKGGSTFDVIITNKTAIVLTKKDGSTFEVPLPVASLQVPMQSISMNINWGEIRTASTTLFATGGTPPYTWTHLFSSVVNTYGSMQVGIWGDQLNVEISLATPDIPTRLGWLADIHVGVTDSANKTATGKIQVSANGAGLQL